MNYKHWNRLRFAEKLGENGQEIIGDTGFSERLKVFCRLQTHESARKLSLTQTPKEDRGIYRAVKLNF